MWVYGVEGDLWEQSIPINQRQILFIYYFFLIISFTNLLILQLTILTIIISFY